MDFSKWITRAKKEPMLWGWLIDDEATSPIDFHRRINSQELLEAQGLNLGNFNTWWWDNTSRLNQLFNNEWENVRDIDEVFGSAYNNDTDNLILNYMNNIDARIGNR